MKICPLSSALAVASAFLVLTAVDATASGSRQIKPATLSFRLHDGGERMQRRPAGSRRARNRPWSRHHLGAVNSFESSTIVVSNLAVRGAHKPGSVRHFQAVRVQRSGYAPSVQRRALRRINKPGTLALRHQTQQTH